jgi:Subtilase family/Fn3-like domain
MVDVDDGALLRANASGTLSFPELATGQYIQNTESGGFISAFSTWGPSNELKVKPNIASPGGNIYSTFPLALGAYAVLSGTSMATPYIAGVATLFLSAKGHIDPLNLRDRMSITSEQLDFNNGLETSVGTLAPVIQQGAGFINASRLFTSTTILSPAFIELNVLPFFEDLTFQDTTNFAGTQVISITNNGSASTSYSFDILIAPTTYGFSNTTGPITDFPPILVNSTPISVGFSPPTLQVQPGQSANVTLTFVLAPNFDETGVPVYSGWVLVNSSASEDGGALQIPFLGVATNMSSLPILDTLQGFPSLTTAANAPNNSITTDGAVFTLTNLSTTPSLNYQFVFGPRILRIDALPGDGNSAATTDFAGLGILGYVLGRILL